MSEAVKALLNYRQADEDGIMVLTSRQAIHEVAARIEQLEAALRPFAARTNSEDYIKTWPDNGLCAAMSYEVGHYREARAALVENARIAIAKAIISDEDGIEAVIDLIRAEVLEEAARVADEQSKALLDEAHDQKVWGNGAMSKRALSIADFFSKHAAAIRALKSKP